jgi:hypothetical protein
MPTVTRLSDPIRQAPGAPSHRTVWGRGLAVGALGLAYGPTLVNHMRHAADPLIFNDDARQFVTPFLVPGYASEYYRTFLAPGYQGLYGLVGAAVDPAAASAALTYVLLGILLYALAVAGGRLGGTAAAVGTVALALSTGIFLDRIVGALPRSFGFPLLACAAVALIAGRPRALAALVVLSAAFYPPAAVVSGLALALWLVALPRWTGLASTLWTGHRRARLVGVTAVGTLLVLAPGLTARGYGPTLTPGDAAAYPEVGPGGRYFPEGRASFESFASELRTVLKPTLTGAPGPSWSMRLREWSRPHEARLLGAALALTALGLAVLAWREPAARRLLVLAAAALVAHTASGVAAPHLFLPQRYVLYPMPIVILLGLPVAAAALAGLVLPLRRAPWGRPAAALAATAVCLALLGSRGYQQTGLTIDAREQAPLLAFLAQLPENALVAGWPGGVIENVPYVSRRQAFLTFETHAAFHPRYLDEMRRRMRALIEAVFAVDPEPIRRLRVEWGVTHLIVDRRHYGASPPAYFRPFDAWLRAALDSARERGFEVPRQLEAVTVFADGELRLLELDRLHTNPVVPAGG